MFVNSWHSIRALFIISMMVISMSACSTNDKPREPEIYLLPDNYVGSFYIIFNAANGKPPQYENNSRVHVIPPNGVLLTQMDSNEGWIDQSLIKFYYNKDGNRVEIKDRWTTSFPDNEEERKDSTTYIFGGGIGIFETQDTPCIISYQSFYAGKKAEGLDNVNHFQISKYVENNKIDCTGMEVSNLNYGG